MKMWKSLLLLLCLCGYCCAGPLGLKKNMPIVQHQDPTLLKETAVYEQEDSEDHRRSPELSLMPTLTLPSNATSIRADITDSFSCDNKAYGYYADVENDCQIFHVCLPVTYADGKENTFRWSFICPEETIFSQDSFTCMRPGDMTIECEESFKYYELNRNFGSVEEDTSRNPDNRIAAANEDQQSAMTTQVDVQPVVEEKHDQISEAPSAPSFVEPIKETRKPVKATVPSRRKPVQSQTLIKKKPASSYQLRKVPPVSDELAPAPTSVQIVDPAPSEAEVKPVNQRFNKRPTIASTAFKDKVQAQKPEKVNPVRAELYNQVRKRPSYFNKKDAAAVPTSKPSEQEMEQPQPQLAEPEPTLKLESIFTPNRQAASDVVHVAEADEALEASSDSAAQPSETAAVYVKPAEDPMLVKTEDVENTNEFTSAQPDVSVGVPANSEAPVEVSIELEVAKNEPGSKPEVPIEEIQKVEEQTPVVPSEAVAVSDDAVTQVANVEEAVRAEEAVKTEDLASGVLAADGQNTVEEVVATETKKNQDAAVVGTSNEYDNTEELAAEQPKQEDVPALSVAYETENEKKEESAIEPEVVPEEEEDNSVVELAKEAEETKPEPEAIASSVDIENALPIKPDEPEIAETVEESVSVEAAKESDAVTPIAAIEEIPAVIAEVEETKPESTEAEHVEEVSANNTPVTEELKAPVETVATVAEPEVDDSSPTLEEMEDAKPVDAIETMAATPEMQVHDPIVQTMFANTLKQSSGGFKPVDPEMAAEAEALITDFLSTLMKSDSSNNKPIYPNESQPEAEIVENSIEEAEDEPQHSFAEAEPEVVQETKVEDVPENENAVEAEPEEESHKEKTKNNETGDNSVAEESVVVPETAYVAFPVAVNGDETSSETKAEAVPEVAEVQPQMLQNEFPASNMLMFNHFPDSMYHIPVKVISTPVEEEENSPPAFVVETVAETTQQHAEGVPAKEEAQPEAVAAVAAVSSVEQNESEDEQQIKFTENTPVYNPISIDDIVELVKERLEQKPTVANEAPTKAIEPQAAEEAHASEPAEDKSSQSQSDEQIIMPIYQRVIDADPNMLKAQNLLVNEPTVITKDSEGETLVASEDTKQSLDMQEGSETVPAAAEIETEAMSETQEPQAAKETSEDQPKTARSYRSRSMKNAKMDPRKRRFLFRSDAS